VATFILWKKHAIEPHWMLADTFLVGYVAINLFSSLVMSVAPAQNWKWGVQQALVILPYFLLRFLAGNEDRFRWTVRMLITLAAAEGAYGLVCFFSNFFFGTDFGVEIGQYGTFPGTYGTLFEANILGSFSGAGFVMALVMYFK